MGDGANGIAPRSTGPLNFGRPFLATNEGNEMAVEMCEVEVWVLVDENGDAVADVNPEHLRDEYEADVGDLEPQMARRVVKITVRIPKPRPVELVAVIGDEPQTAEVVLA